MKCEKRWKARLHSLKIYSTVWGFGSVIQPFPIMCEAMGSNSITKKQNKTEQN